MLFLVVVLGALFAREAQAYYNPSTGRWLSRDPIGESPDRNLYAFVRNVPLDSIDPEGLVKVSLFSFDEGKCGTGYVGYFKLELDQWNPTVQGYFVQKVTITDEVAVCGVPRKTIVKVFWEAFELPPLKPGNMDRFVMDYRRLQIPQGSRGKNVASGEIKFYSGRDMSMFTIGGSSGAGTLPSTEVEPPWWNDPSDAGEKTGTLRVKALWSCCGNLPIYKVTHSP